MYAAGSPLRFSARAGAARDEYDEILASAGDMEGKIPVNSNERLCGCPHNGGRDARRIAEWLRQAFPEARILCTIREQKQMICSSYLQYLRNGGTSSLSTLNEPKSAKMSATPIVI